LARTYFTHNRIVLLIFCHPFCIAIQMSPGGPYLPSFGRCGVSVLLTNTGFNFSYYRRLRNLDNVSFAGDFLHSLAPATLMQTGWQYNTSNQLTSTPSVTYTYDNNGNTLTKVDSGGTTSYAWDIESRLATVTLPGAGGMVSFMYDPFGRRIQKSSAAGTTSYVYDGANIVAEFDAAGTLVARYSQGQGIDQPLAVVRQGTAAYYNADGLGSITSLRDVNGSVVATYSYDAFGNTTATSSINNPFQYTGREWDSETGLYYYRARYYEPAVGRFTSEDPIRFVGGFNFYRYVENSPVNIGDPFGLATYLCKKPLHSMGGDGSRSGPDIFGNPFYHEYVCVSSGPNTPVTCGGMDRTGNAVWSPGKPSEGDQYSSEACHQEVPDNACVESCVRDKIAGPRPRYGVGPQGTDCQEWASDVVSECKAQCKKKRSSK
jgi:RHS repeat-associated protein